MGKVLMSIQTPKMMDDKEQDQASRIAGGRGEEAVMLEQSQESQQDKEVSHVTNAGQYATNRR